jgi:hypothetical protein
VKNDVWIWHFPGKWVKGKTQGLDDDVVAGLDSVERADLSKQLGKFSLPPEAT